MTKAQLSEMKVEDLVEQFADLSTLQGRAQDLLASSAKINRLGRRIYEISKELESRPGDQRGALLRLFDHPDDWVRFNAATSTISIERKQARDVIQAIKDSKIFPQAGHAGMYLSMYDGEAARILRK